MCTTCGCGGTAPEGAGRRRRISLERNLLARNDAFAAANRAAWTDRGVLALNLVSSPGSGKTSLLVETLRRLRGRVPAAVLEGDQRTARDAERIRAAGFPALQINTGKGCHLDAHAVGHAAERLAPEAGSVLFIENVGNLVCPAAFDLGEACKVVVLSVTEGEDKPLKYPDMFAAAGVLLLNKVDLLPHLAFDVEACLAMAFQVNPALQVFRTSAATGEGLDAWADWVLQRSAARAPAEAAP
ncbi:MAG: hydrogenase nickel incorporation protein HypB [Holophagaceae bacterium]